MRFTRHDVLSGHSTFGFFPAAGDSVRLHFLGAKDTPEFFETKVRPVLANDCLACHGASKMGG
jgi:hypothetical protein